MIKEKFTIAKKGYSQSEVDNYITEKEKNFEQVFKEQKERIASLKARNFELENEVKDFKEREDEIKKSIVAATDKANEMTLDLKLQYAMEIERLKIFQAKWTNCYEELKERYHFSKDALNLESIVTQTAIELEDKLHSGFSLDKASTGSDMERQFKGEIKRLKGDDEELNSLFEKLKEEIKKASMIKQRDVAASTSGFSMEEALKSDESLEEICRSLGINNSKRA